MTAIATYPRLRLSLPRSPGAAPPRLTRPRPAVAGDHDPATDYREGLRLLALLRRPRTSPELANDARMPHHAVCGHLEGLMTFGLVHCLGSGYTLTWAGEAVADCGWPWGTGRR